MDTVGAFFDNIIHENRHSPLKYISSLTFIQIRLNMKWNYSILKPKIDTDTASRQIIYVDK